ncbi:hypothetical protein A1O3_04454 [Capronia epimyces CBS 606.96]|uniref:Glucose-inducible SAM-dependent methyltransferase Rrg1 n=1 Tax=Capronia epimyces CBS 606.96 TaxID=1182542 RepID=W9YYX4_9EURO|nr:uncharacterized protein A1O3_04454 [Capronia epimyces CBS 606.96]EXJ87494.1 hypothetical protein A1O3_04454 [Capronia epimyces CBS 606.96]
MCPYLEEPPDSASKPLDPLVLHVHDLPQLYQRPSATTLLQTLDLLCCETPSFSKINHARQVKVAEQGVPGYLTSVVSSTLHWIDDDEAKESIWSAASARLSERSGRNAMPSMTRSFMINDSLSISLHEPSLTGDSLGLKTWTSSLLLSQRLGQCRRYIPQDCARVLELGAGTGLVGISAACLWNKHVLLTDLPEIVPNLQRNLEHNRSVITDNHGSVEARALDWADETDTPGDEQEKFMVILAADPIYSPDHPRMLVNTVRRWICPNPKARFIVELPLRDRYDQERQNLRETLRHEDFELVAEGTDTGFDDWHGRDGHPVEVECWWSVWKPDR